MIQNTRFVEVRVKFLHLHFDAKSYIEGLNIIFNIITNQYMFHFIQSSAWIIMLTNHQIFYYHVQWQNMSFYNCSYSSTIIFLVVLKVVYVIF
jgi:hypothetical protein